MTVIVAQVNQFKYFLRFDELGEGHAEGLINNATKLSKEMAESLINSLDCIWPYPYRRHPLSTKGGSGGKIKEW
jgi:hypothetical protein